MSSAAHRTVSEPALRQRNHSTQLSRNSSISTAASAAVSNASLRAGGLASSVTAAMTAGIAAAGGRRQSMPTLGMRLPALPGKKRRKSMPALTACLAVQKQNSSLHQSDHLPHLSLEGPKSERPALSLHNCGLVRWVFEEAKLMHTSRAEYEARKSDTTRDPGMNMVIFREVCTDILSATRLCCNAYRAVESLSELAAERKEADARKAAGEKAAAQKRLLIALRFQKVRRKMFAFVSFAKMLRRMRDDSSSAEQMWKQCFAGLGSMSLGVSSKALASRSIGLRAFQGCGSISLGLRKYRKTGSIGFND